MNKKLFIVLLAILTLPVVLLAQNQIQQLLSRAAPKPANIIVETKNVLGPLNKSWAAFSQGGEEAPPVLSHVIDRMKEVTPRYIRIDHVYDANNVVSKKGNEYAYDFSTLDKVVDDIISMGALPFFSLSYMPKSFNSTNSLIDAPNNWNDWKNLVKATIQHYSGKNFRNLAGIYYEIWNEPELPQFGNWKLGEPKDYRLLYFYATQGANEVTDVNKFYLGGPSVGSYYPNWVSGFVSYIAQNNLRLDFYSWHRYTKRPSEYASDAQKIRSLLSSYRSYSNIPLLLTEWGIDSENTDINNTNTAAAYAIYAASQFGNNIDLAFNFEVKDGPPPAGGKWGLLSHEVSPDKPLSPKPKFNAFAQLAKLSGNTISLSGSGTYVSGIAASSSDGIKTILANYDIAGKNTENVPVTFTGLDPAIYQLKYNYVLDNTNGFYEIPATSGNITKSFLMQANSILYIELVKTSQVATFVNGFNPQTFDRALVLSNMDNPLTFSSPEFHLLPVGSVSFDIKPFWGKSDKRSFFIFEAPFTIVEATPDKLSLSKQRLDSGNSMVFSITQDSLSHNLTIPIDNWGSDTWHHIELGWSQSGMWMIIDGNRSETSDTLDVRNGKIITFSPMDAAIDNLKIRVGKELVIERNFDGRIDN